MSANIFTDPQAVRTLHDLVTDARVGAGVHATYLALRGQSLADGVSYPHFMVQLKTGMIPLCGLRPLTDAMRAHGLDPECALMAMFAECMPAVDHTDGTLNDEFCGTVQELSGIAQHVQSGHSLRDIAANDCRALELTIGRIALLARRMAHEILTACRAEAA